MAGCFTKMRQGNMPWSAFCGRSSCRILSTSPVIPSKAKDLAVLTAGYAPCHLERSERSIPSATPTQTGHKNPPIRARFGFFLNPGTKSALFVPALDRIISCSRKAQRVRVRVLSKGYRLRLPLRFDPEGAANTLQSILKGRCPAPWRNRLASGRNQYDHPRNPCTNEEGGEEISKDSVMHDEHCFFKKRIARQLYDDVLSSGI